MEEIIKQYGSSIIAVIAVIGLVALTVWLVVSNSSPVKSQFQSLITDFFSKAKEAFTNIQTN